MGIWLVLLIIVAVLVLLFLGVSYYAMLYVTKPKVRSMADGEKREKDAGRWGCYDDYDKEEWDIPSFDGYLLHGTLIKNTSPGAEDNKFVIITHGYTSNRYGSLQYVHIFYDLGYQVYIYDDRNHGANAPVYTSMGYNEKRDLIAVTEAVQQRFGADVKIGLHGESLGCAISLLALGMSRDFLFCVADCGYADLGLLLDDLIGVQMHLPKVVARMASVWCRLIHGFSLYAIKPYQALADNRTPILFIHGEADTFIDKKHSQMNYDAAVCKKELHFFPGAEHAVSCVSDPQRYRRLVTDFVRACEGCADA